MGRFFKFMLGLISLVLGLMIGIWMLVNIFSGEGDVSFGTLFFPGIMIWVGFSWMRSAWLGPPLEVLPLKHPEILAAFARSRKQLGEFKHLLSRFPDDAMVLCSATHYTEFAVDSDVEPDWVKATGHADETVLIVTEQGQPSGVHFEHILDWQVKDHEGTVYGAGMLRVLLEHTRHKHGKLPGRWQKLANVLAQ